jgi:hypothetical protein
MAPWSALTESAKDEGQEQDLTTLLTKSERIDFTLLLANITERMQKQVSDTFDAGVVGLSQSSKQSFKAGEKNPNLEGMSRSEETEEEQNARKLHDAREKELSAPEMQVLKKSALEYFQQWQDSVILRVGEVMNSKETAVKQEEEIKASGTAAVETPAAPVHKISNVEAVARGTFNSTYVPISHTLDTDHFIYSRLKIRSHGRHRRS